MGGVRDRRVWLGAGISLAFVVLTLRDTRWEEVSGALYQVDPWMVVLAVASFVATGIAKAARWNLLFALHQSPPLSKAFSILSVGLLLNAFAPARLGELARAYLIGESQTESKIYALGTIAVEKIADLVFLLISIALLLSQMTLPDWLAAPARVTAVTILISVPVLFLLAQQRRAVLSGLGRVMDRGAFAWKNWLLERISRGLESLLVLREPRLMTGVIGWTALIWVLGASTNYLVFGAMRLALSGWAALLLLVVLQVGIAVPSSPGRIGVFHYLVVLTLSIFSVSKDIALSYSVILYLVIFVPIAVIGAYCLWSEKITWQKLLQAAAFSSHLRAGANKSVQG